MTTVLSNYSAIETALFVKIVIPGYTTLFFSDYNRDITLSGETYLGLGKLVAITATQSELRSSENQLTITMVGIKDVDLPGIINSKIKGSKIQVVRAFFNSNTGEMVPDVGPIGRFFGIVNNYSLEESFDMGATTTSNTINIICSSAVEILSNKYSGRRTNPTDQKKFYPTDLSMDRVPALANSNFDFGKATG